MTFFVDDAGCVREQIRAITGHTIASINEVLDRYTKLTAEHRTRSQKRAKTLICLHSSDGAPGRTRTNTSVRKPDFESEQLSPLRGWNY